MRLEPDYPMIAVSKDDTKHQTYTFHEIDKCRSARPGHNELLLCPNANLYYREDDNSCIVGLFKRNMQVVRDHCRWKAAARKSYSLQVNANQFLVFLPESEELKIVCSDGVRTIEKRMEVDGHQLVTIQGLCKGYISR